MKTLKILSVLAATVFLVLVTFHVRAYIGAPPTSSTYTNHLLDLPTGAANFIEVFKTNPVTRFTNVVIAFDIQLTNASAGTFDCAYTTGPDWGMETSVKKWFSIPLTNSRLVYRTIWNTNVPINSHGAFTLVAVTNMSGQNLTNLSIRFFTKGGVINLRR